MTDGSGFFRVFDTSHQPAIPLTLYMSGELERPTPLTNTAAGSGTLSLEGNTLKFSIVYSGLSGPAIAAHIHGPATTAQSTSVVLDLSPYSVGGFSTQGVFSGVVVISDELKAMILAGKAYVNVHTQAHQSGELRGQIAPVTMQAEFRGSGEGSGFGVLALAGNRLTMSVTYQGLSGPAQAAHIHGPASPSEDAGVLVSLEPLNAGVFGKQGSFAGTVTLTPTQLGYLIDGLTYINIHTVAAPGGEIRAQI